MLTGQSSSTLTTRLGVISILFLCLAHQTSVFTLPVFDSNSGSPDNVEIEHIRDKRSNIPCGTSFTPCNRRQGVGGVVEPFLTSESRDAPDENTGQSVTAPNIRHQMLNLAISESHDDVDRLFNQTEPSVSQSNDGIVTFYSSLFAKSTARTKELSYSALISIGASQRLRSFGLRTEEIIYGLPKMEIDGTALQQVCPPNPIEECVPGRFRTYSGFCNNVNHPLWGATNEPMTRYLAPDYADEVNAPRAASDGSSLPNPRDISLLIFQDRDNIQKKCSLMIMQWFQFIYNDIIHIGSVKGAGLKPLPCCEGINHPECLPVNISSNDPIYGTFVTCFPYARTSPAPREDCLLGTREQINMATSFLDGSGIYGSTSHEAKELRAFKDGKLQVLNNLPVKNLLPQAAFDENECRSTRSQLCFKAGSYHVNLMPTLTALHTIWVRQHNRLAEQLKSFNPHWDDERLFQEARKIVGAQIQHITFGELFPVIVGTEQMQKYDLALQSGGFYADYDLRTNPGVLNSFAASAGLFFYTLLPDELALVDRRRLKSGQRSISDYLLDPGSLYFPERLEGFLRFLLTENIREVDPYFPKDLTSKFLKNAHGDLGVDLPALIVQMGRDHGIPSYTVWRAHCGLKPIKSFEELAENLRDSSIIHDLQRLYRSVEDVDLFVLGLAEKPSSGALVGPTFGCILSRQFQKLRRGDRFWYENFFFPSAFEQDQLTELRKTTFSRILCDNAEDIGPIQPNVFMSPDDFENYPMDCNSSIIHSMDLRPWIDSEPRLQLPITQQTLEKAVRLGRMQAKDIEEKEQQQIQERNVPLKPGDSLFAHSQILSAKKEALDQAAVSKVLLETTKILIRGDGLDDDEKLPRKLDVATLQRLLPQIDVSHIVGNVSGNNERCVPKEFPCDHTYPYRTYSGWCNNVRFPAYGNAFNPFRRLLDPVYDNGFDEPRKKAANGHEQLPSPRHVSNQVHNTEVHLHVKYTHMLMQFGQLVDHDMTHSPIHTGPKGQTLNCSSCDSRETVSINCYPIPVPQDDPHFPPTGPDGSPKCLALTRSILGQLTLGYREQIDQLTSFLDASNVYGSTECQANDLRLFSGGKLNFTESYDGLKEGLPQGFKEKECRSLPNGHMCFLAGDGRVNEQTGLAAIHTVFMREHNRIATRLSRINNFWSDEKLYQETRKVVSAMMQHIVFNEFLPKVMGMEQMQKFGLILKKEGYYTEYDQYCDATVSNELATAAFRFGHTLIRSEFARMDDFYHNFSDPLRLKTMFMNTTPIYDSSNGGVETILLGLVGVPAESFDRHITQDVRNHLFEKPNSPFSGMDLISLNIQRAREHGIQPYNAYREFCGLRKAKSFEDLSDTTNDDAIEALKRAYKNVDDIDLFPGLMTETSVRGGLVGPTIACIIGEQFQRLRKCDRFWYENDLPETRFTPDQLTQIRQTTLAKLVCQNSQFIRKIQPRIFDMPDELQNTQVPCQDLPEVDLYEWLDRQFCVVDHRVINLGKAKRITPCVSCTCTAEGPECHSIKVNDCDKLMEEFLHSEIADDTVCVIQCSSVIKRKSSTSTRELTRRLFRK